MPRKISQENALGGSALNYAYNDKAGALKQIPTYGAMIPMGSADSQVNVGRGKLVAFYNNDTAVHFVKFGSEETMSAPTTPADGVPIAAGMFIVLNTGTQVSFMADSAEVYWYDVQDDTYIQE